MLIGTHELIPGVAVEIEATIPDDQPDPDVLVVELSAGRLVGVEADGE